MSEGESIPVTAIRTRAYRIPTDGPESDGTLSWAATTLVLAEIEAAGRRGLGYTYAGPGAAAVIQHHLAGALKGHNALDIPGCWAAMWREVRNLGRSGLAACAISAVDLALWDLKARCLERPLATLIGRCREQVPIYGSGGFTNYTDDQLRSQLSGWVERDGCQFVKMKIGRDPDRDPHRVTVARSAIHDRELFVDANGAFSVKAALCFAALCPEIGIHWFEEPVTSDDADALHMVREHTPPVVQVAAGEYTYTLDDATRLIDARAVDVMQADVTRCGGVSGFLKVAALCEAHHLDLSGHCAPSMHRHVACAVQRLRHLEWFHDHVRIEQMLFDGAPVARDGTISPDLSRHGHGLELKTRDAERFEVVS